MKLDITETLKKNHFILLICIAATLPFFINHVQLNSFFILLLMGNALPLAIFSKEYKSKQKFGILFLFISLFIIHVVGLIRTDNFHEAIFELQKKFSIFLFPLIIVFTPKINSQQIKIILFAFVYSCVAVGLLCLSVSIYRCLFDNDSSYLFYHNLSGIAGMHAVYLSMHCCFAIAIVIYYNWEKAVNLKSGKDILHVFSLLVLFCMIFLLAARIQISLFIIGIIIGYVFFFIKNKNRAKSLLFFFIFTIAAAGFIFLIPVNRDRFKEAINYNNEYPIEKQWGGRALRELKWSCAAELIQENFFTGLGTGDVQDELQKLYIEHKYVPLTFWKDTQYNAHNQFLETFVGLGIAGFIILSFCLLFALFLAYKNKNPLYFIFILLFAISCLTESLLERQHGIVFYAFFNSLFAFHVSQQS